MGGAKQGSSCSLEQPAVKGALVPAAEIPSTGSVTARDSCEWPEWEVFLMALVLLSASGL